MMRKFRGSLLLAGSAVNAEDTSTTGTLASVFLTFMSAAAAPMQASTRTTFSVRRRRCGHERRERGARGRAIAPKGTSGARAIRNMTTGFLWHDSAVASAHL